MNRNSTALMYMSVNVKDTFTIDLNLTVLFLQIIKHFVFFRAGEVLIRFVLCLVVFEP